VNLLPKPNDGVGTGAHAHLSIWQDGKSATGDSSKPFGLSDAFNSFLAGILKYYPALVHFLAPSYNSTRRIIPGYFAGRYTIWGIDNKEAPVRVVGYSKA
jgi:glutamine synthetase